MNKPENRYFALTKAPAFHRAPCLSEAQNFAGEEGYVWLDYIDPTAESLAELESRLGIHPLSIEELLNGDQLPKLTFFRVIRL